MMEKYCVLEQLGEGGFGDVYLAKRKVDEKKVAIKCIPLEKINRWHGEIPAEVAILDRLKDVKGVCKILDHFKDDAIYNIVMEYYEGRDLFDYIACKKNLSPEESKSIAEQLVEVLIELEEKNIYHNDIKDENIMMNDEKIALIDFGAATTEKNELETWFAGTRVFAPPEYIVDGAYNPERATSWMVGTVLFNMLAGDIPFQSDEDILKGEYFLPIGVPESTRLLVEKCLAKNPRDRPCLQEIYRELTK